MKFGRKLMGTALCICMLLLMLGGMTTVAAEGVDLIRNGDFTATNDSEDKTPYWNMTNAELIQEQDNNYVKLVASRNEDGSSAISPYASQSRSTITTAQGNTEYLLSFRYKADKANGPRFSVVQYDEAGTKLHDSDEILLEKTDDNWQTVTYAFKTHAETRALDITIKVNGYQADNGGTITMLLDDVSLYPVTNSGVYANGSFEYADTEGNVSGVFGGTVTDTAKYNGEKSLLVAAGEKGGVQLATTDFEVKTNRTNGDSVVVSGYVKVATGDTATVTVHNTTPAAPVEKKVVIAGNGGWQKFRFIENEIWTNLVVAVTAGSGDAYLDGICIEEDVNVFPDGSFETAEYEGWVANRSVSIPAEKVEDPTVIPSMAHYVVEANDAIDGNRYLYIGEGDRYTYIETEYITPLVSGTRYILSFWYNCTADSMQINDTNDRVRINFDNTDGEWRYAEIVMEEEVTEEKPSFRLFFRYTAKEDSRKETESYTLQQGEYLKIDMVELRVLTDSESKVGFYKTATYGGTKENRIPYQNHLGHPVNSATGLDSINAIYVSPTGTTAGNDEVVLLAAYTTDKNGVKQLVGFTMGDADVPEQGDAYPTATLSLTDIPAGAELQAFAWDSASGMKAVQKSPVITK